MTIVELFKQTYFTHTMFMKKLYVGRRIQALFVKKQSDGEGEGEKCQGKCKI